MPGYFSDHGLPLVQLKELRRDLVVAHQKRNAPLTKEELTEIATVQQAISAFETVIADLDTELEAEPPVFNIFSARSCRMGSPN
jgi:hypothetical protein